MDDPNVEPGDTVVLAAGTYAQFVENSNAYPWDNSRHYHRASWITYRAAAGAAVTIPGVYIYNGDMAQGNPYPSGDSCLAFDGINFTASVNCRRTTHIKVLNCDVVETPLSIQGYYAPYYSGLDTSAAIQMSDATYVTVQGCDIHNCADGIFATSDGNYIGNTVHDFAVDGIHFSAPTTDCIVHSNTITRAANLRHARTGLIGTKSGTWVDNEVVTQDDSGATGIYGSAGSDRIYIWQTSQTDFITGNHAVRGASATLSNLTSVDYEHSDFISIQGDNTNVTISNNFIHDPNKAIWTGIKLSVLDVGGQLHSTNCHITGNLIYDTEHWGIVVYKDSASGPQTGQFSGLQICNNTLCGNGIIHLRNSAHVQDLYNNICPQLIADAASGIVITNHGNNIFQASPNIGQGCDFTLHLTETVLGSLSAYKALFTNYDSNDYTLAAGSTAINFGNATYAPTTDILGHPRVGAPDAGAYECIPQDPNSAVYTLSVTATHGSVTRSPDKTRYSLNETVTLQAVAATGYTFTGWSGGLSGTSNPATIRMDGNKSVTASFASAATQYTLATSATHGSVARTPDKASYGYGETVSLQATPDSGYNFAGWSGDLSGANNPATILMDGNKSVTAKFAGDACTLSASAVHGSVTTTPDKATYSHSETVVLQAVPDSGYVFVGWSGDLSGTTNPANLTMDTDKSVTAAFAIAVSDHTSPSVSHGTPAAGAIQVPLNTLVTLHVTDSGSGVDANSVTIQVNGESVYSGNSGHYASASGDCRRTGTPADYQYCFQPGEAFGFDQQVAVTVTASDLAGNAMTPYTYVFSTEMRSFGKNWKVSSNPTNSDKAHPACAADSRGDLWIAWHAGQEGSRDIYVTMLDAQTHRFGTAIQLTTNSADQCNPALAVSPDDQVYVVWQDNSRGNWDICGSKTSDGTTWASTARLSDSNDQEVHPVIAVDHSSPPRAYVAWQDHRSGNYDIYVACTDNAFVSQTLWQVTSNAADQTDPAMAISADGTVYLVWTDLRNASADIYGASSSNGFASNVPMVTASGDQTHPAIAAEPTGSVLHLVWVDDAGNADVYYATCDGLPSGPLTGVDIIDDATGAQQVSPAITASSAGVFACWTDYRRAGSSTDTDLYFADLGSGSSGTNVLVGDERTNSNQAEPALGVDSLGHPFVVWTDSRNTHAEIYLAGNTYVKPEPFRSSLISASEGGTVGTPPAAVDSNDDVSVALPAGACASDMTVSISQIENTPATSLEFLAAYDFGPSGAQFNQPVTVTIPYTVSNASASVTPYWYDPLTDALSQQGITAVNRVVISSTLHALTFKTTHFTQFYLVAEDSQTGSGGGGGGCSLAPAPDDGQVLEFLIPYIGLAVAMAGLRVRDRSRQSGKRSANG